VVATTHDTNSVVGLFLKSFRLAKTLLLGLKGMDGEILEIFVYLLLDVLLGALMANKDNKSFRKCISAQFNRSISNKNLS